MGESNNILKIHPTDNVAVAIKDLQKGERVRLEGKSFKLETNVEFGHKVATSLIQKGDPIVKYGVHIGCATSRIKVGDHVHVHNIKSLYVDQFSK